MRKVADLEPQSLKAILVDAGRYRWLRENLPELGTNELYGWNGHDRYLNPDELDMFVDGSLSHE